jgi:hypothetical protein
MIHCIHDGSPMTQVKDGKGIYLCEICRRVQILRTNPNTNIQTITLFANTLEAAGMEPSAFQVEMFS